MARNSKKKLRMDPEWSTNDLKDTFNSGLDLISSFGPFGVARSIFTGKTPTVPGLATVSGSLRQGVDNAVNWLSDKASSLWDGLKESNIYRKYTGSGLTDAEIQQNEFQERLSNTAYQRQVADMQAAGVNPALTMGGSSSGASTPSGASPSGGASLGDLFGSIVSLVSLPAQLKLLNAQAKATSAQATKTEAEIPWIDKLNLADLMSKKVGYQLSKEQFEVIEYAKHKTLSEIAHLTAQTESEDVRRFWLESDIALKRMQANEIAQLLPYRQLLMDAQTDAQRAEASFRVLQRANQEKLWTDEYIDSLIHISIAEAGIKDSEDTFKRVKNIVNGVTAFEDDTELNKVGIQVGESLRRIIPGAKPIYSE